MFLVCMGHAFTMLSVGEGAMPCRMLYTFHMPLFMLMCGFFSHHALTMPFGPFIKKKAMQLLVPTVAFVGLDFQKVCTDGIQEYVLAPTVGGATVLVCYAIARLMKRNKVTARLFLGV